MRLSIVTTLYRSGPFVKEFHRRMTGAARALTEDYEIVFVDDGSPDDSFAQVRQLQETDDHVVVVELSRNFGHHPAIWIGLKQARGDLVFLLDSDLEEEPEWLHSFNEQLKTFGDDVVYGVALKRNGSIAKKWGGFLFYKGMNLLADIPIPENLITARLMNRSFVDALLSHSEVTFALSGLWARTGFRQSALEVQKKARANPSYNFLKRLLMLVHTVTAFSSKPLVLGFYAGILIFLAAVVGAGKLVFDRLFGSTPPEGWTSLQISIWGIGGLILLCQGIQGIYLSKIYLEAKRRPVAIIRKVHRGKAINAGDVSTAA